MDLGLSLEELFFYGAVVVFVGLLALAVYVNLRGE